MIPKSFYKTHDLFKFHNKNVVYMAYVGKYNDKQVYKYGVSSNVYNREYLQHRKQFEEFTMCWIKTTANMTQAEDLFEKELKIRDLHLTMTINNKKQTELFSPSDDYSFDYLQRLFGRITRHVDKDIIQEVKRLKKEVKTLKANKYISK